MKAWQITEHGSLDGLRLAEWPETGPGHGEVLVQLRAVSLNYRDLSAVRSARPGNLPPPLVPCSDGAGEVIAVGPGVTQWQPGDRVAGTFFQSWTSGPVSRDVMRRALGGPVQGVLREQAVLQADGLTRVPAGLSFEQAATLPCAGVTAWHALVSNGRLCAGQTVLALGTGGVSIFALQIAKLHGARVILTSRSAEKLARALALGADETIDTTAAPDWERTVHDMTGGTGVDHVIETGGAGTLEKSFAAVRLGGHVHLMGILSGLEGRINPWPLIAKSICLHGLYVGTRDMQDALTTALAASHAHPVIDRVFDFDDARDAFAHLESGSHFGKVVISLG